LLLLLVDEQEGCGVPYWVNRILLKSGDLVTEKELGRDENYFRGAAPVVGDVINVRCRGRSFDAKVVWGNWPGRDHAAKTVVPLRVEVI
jgi:hypothetical protein